MKTEKELRDALLTMRKYINIHLDLYDQGKVNIGQAHFDMLYLRREIEEVLGFNETKDSDS